MTMLSATLAKIDEVNARDPNRVIHEGHSIAKEVLYSQRMSAWLAKLQPDASEVLQIACRAQHIARWESQRSDYPDGRKGYKAWRASLLIFHARTTAKLLREVGYASVQIENVSETLQKLNRAEAADSQSLEDVACLVFLEFELDAFSKKHEGDKMRRILKRTWEKMSPRAQEQALGLEYSSEVQELLHEALA